MFADPILGASFAAEHPELRTFLVVGIDDPRLTGRLDRTPAGLHALIFTGDGIALVDPVASPEIVEVHLAFDRAAEAFDCLADGATWPTRVLPASGSSSDQLRTYRFILMSTGEYAQSLGGVSAALAQMTTAMNRIQAIFERDMAVRLEVVQMMTFDDPATDPYPANDVGDLLTRNRAVVDSIFGSDSYDMTQVISVRSGYRGTSFRPLFCEETFKGESSVYGTDATSDQFVIKVMPHEIGHTLGATHSQDGGSNRAPITAYEPALGWTIMTSPGDPASFGDAFFHVANLDQMDTTLVSPCGSFTASGNHVPTADAGLNYVIPRGTPFVLTGSGADADAGDALTYTWDEVDKAPSAGNITLGPRFRWRPPTSAPIRSFPALATVLANTSDTLEALPTVDRLLTFRLTVRDNHPGAGAHAWDECVLTVSGAPFAVTSPNGGESLPSDQPFDVTWNVGGGSVAAFVDLFISTDGGASWSTLASHVANDGSQSVSQIVGTTRTHCRVKVAASGNVFYDVSNADFTLIDGVTAVASGAVVERLAIRNVAPNPARGRIAIEYSLPHAERGRLSIVDIQGRIVAVLADGVLPQGVGHANWISRRSGPGIYCVRLESGGSTVERRFATTR